MDTAVTPPLLEIMIPGVPEVYTETDLRTRADDLIQAIYGLLRLDDVLTCSTLCCSFRIGVDEDRGLCQHFAVLSLALRQSRQLSLFTGVEDTVDVESALLADCRGLIAACRSAPQTTNEVALRFSLRVAGAVMGREEQDLPQPFAQTLRTMLQKISRRVQGRIRSEEWGWQLAMFCRHDWDASTSDISARVIREKNGFSLEVLDGGRRPILARRKLSMRFPADRDSVGRLDRATHTAQAISMTVRLGRDPGVEYPCVADFVAFCDAPAASNVRSSAISFVQTSLYR